MKRNANNRVNLSTDHIRRNYKFLKTQMEPNILVDYLVQGSILNEDENSFLIGKPRAKKCDFILRKLLQHEPYLTTLSTMITSSPEEEGFHCFLSLPPFEAAACENAIEKVLHSKCLDKVLNKNISELEREIMLRISGESDSIVDDFLEENVLSVDDHEEISTEIKKSKAANLLLKNISSKLPRSFLKLLSILKEHKINDLGDRLLKDIDKTDWGTTEKEELKVEFIGGDMHFSLIAPKTEIKKIKMIISGDDGNERVFEKVIKEIPKSEEMIAQRTHCTFAKTSLGSITTILRIETSYAMSKLKQFIESEGISLLLTQIFESKDVRAILGKRKCNIEVQIREVQETTDTTCDEFQSTDSQASESTYRSRLERCKSFLLEELEPRCLLKEKEVADIFGPVFKKFSQPELRTTKAEVFLEHLKNQSEKEIEVVLKTLKEKNKYIYDQLFPETTKYQDIGKHIKSFFIRYKSNT